MTFQRQRHELERYDAVTPIGALSCLVRDVDGIRHGTAGPPLVLVHGAQIQARTWLPTVTLLPDALPVLAPDLRCHGQSERVRPIGIADWADDLEAVLDFFGAGPVHVVGHSMGAAVAVELAVRRPGQVLGIITFGGAFLPAPDDDDSVAQSIRTAGAMPTLRRMMVEHVLSPNASESVRDAAVAELSENDDATATAIHAAANKSDVRDHLDAVRCPLRLVSGDEDTICPLDEARWVAEATDSELQLIPGVGHLPQQEAPAATADHIRAGIIDYALKGNS